MALPQEQADKNEAPSWRSKSQAHVKEAPCQRQEQEAPLLKVHLFLLCAMLVPSSWRQKGQLEGTQGLESAGDEKRLKDSKVWNPLRPLPWEACFWLVFRDEIAGFLGKHAWGSSGARKDHKVWNLPRPLP